MYPRVMLELSLIKAITRIVQTVEDGNFRRLPTKSDGEDEEETRL